MVADISRIIARFGSTVSFLNAWMFQFSCLVFYAGGSYLDNGGLIRFSDFDISLWRASLVHHTKTIQFYCWIFIAVLRFSCLIFGLGPIYIPHRQSDSIVRYSKLRIQNINIHGGLRTPVVIVVVVCNLHTNIQTPRYPDLLLTTQPPQPTERRASEPHPRHPTLSIILSIPQSQEPQPQTNSFIPSILYTRPPSHLQGNHKNKKTLLYNMLPILRPRPTHSGRLAKSSVIL